MADFDSSLPTKTENAGDIDVFVSDATTPAQKLKVNADGSIDTNFATGSKIIVTDGTDDLEVNADGSVNAVVSATDLDVRDLDASQDNVAISDGTDTMAVNADGSINSVVTATDLDIRNLTATDVVTIVDGGGAITVDGTVDVGTVTTITNDVSIDDGGNSITVDAVQLDVDDLNATDDAVQAHLYDNTGTAYGPTNPLSVEMVSDQAGDEICDFNTSAAVAKNASVNHDYTVTATKTLLMDQVFASASGKIKVQVLVDGAVVFVGFNSTANPNVEIPMRKICKAGTAEVVRITITNRDNAQDVYSTLTGLEV